MPEYSWFIDIRRFFDTIDHAILKGLIWNSIRDEEMFKLIENIIDSFRVDSSKIEAIGIPLGNVTSQLFANLYLHEFDEFIKYELREKFYLRYCDDFLLLSNDENHLRSRLATIRNFLAGRLKLQLHPQKITIRKLNQGIDFVGYVLFESYSLVRTTTKRRMKRRLREAHKAYLAGQLSSDGFDQRLQSYLGILSHANEKRLSQTLTNVYGIRRK